MSRIGNRKLEIPAGVEVKEENGIVYLPLYMTPFL